MVLWINLTNLIEAAVSIFGETPPGVCVRSMGSSLTEGQEGHRSRPKICSESYYFKVGRWLRRADAISS